MKINTRKPSKVRTVLSVTKKAVALSLLGALSSYANAGIELVNVQDSDNKTSVILGGYAKVDVRHVNGDIAYQDYWVANFPGGEATETSHTGFNVRESRVNFKVTHNDVYGFIEWDFYGGGGNEVVSNSSNERLRHFYIGYKNWMVGQNWSTFMPLAALPEALDFGGPHVGEVFIRQTQIRYTSGNWQFAIENPETNGDGDVGTPASAVDETAFAANISGRIKTGDRNDFRFQVSVGEPGRYVAAGMTPDIVENPDEEVVVEQTTAFTVAYRHFWKDSWRSTIYYGAAETDTLNRDRNHFAVNLMTNVTGKLDAGVELGRYSIEDENIDDINSKYLQFSLKYVF
jgi:hypothetical protein